jgi:hypothetical protein
MRSSVDFLRRKSMDARSTRSSIDCSSAAGNALVGPGWSRVLSTPCRHSTPCDHVAACPSA